MGVDFIMPVCINCNQEISEEQHQQFQKRCSSCFDVYEQAKARKMVTTGIVEMVFGVAVVTFLTVLLVLGGNFLLHLIFIILFAIVFLEGLIRLIRGILKKQQYSNVQPSP